MFGISIVTLVAGALGAALIWLLIEFRSRQPTLADELDEILAAPIAPKPRPTEQLRAALHGNPTAPAAPTPAAIDEVINRLRPGGPPK